VLNANIRVLYIFILFIVLNANVEPILLIFAQFKPRDLLKRDLYLSII